MKKCIVAALSLCLCVLLSMGAFATRASIAEGDINSDGTCDIVDVLLLIRAMLNDAATEDMDLSGDGRVSLVDVIRALKLAVKADAITAPTFVVGNVSAAAGETVTVPVSIVKNPGILGMTLVVGYDDTVMTLTDSTNGDALSMLSFTKPKNYKNGSIFTWYGEALEEDEIIDGGVLTLTFAVAEDAADGAYSVSVSYTEGDIFDADLSSVSVAVRNGTCTVTSGTGEGEGGNTGGDVQEPEEITEPTFVVDAVTASKGETVTVPVSIVKNPGILGMTLTVQYDDTAMTLVNSANGDALSMLSFTKPKRYKNGSIFTWYGEALEAGEISDGGVLVLTFTVAEDAAAGTYPVSVSYTEGDIFDADLSPISIRLQQGSVTVAE